MGTLIDIIIVFAFGGWLLSSLGDRLTKRK